MTENVKTCTGPDCDRKAKAYGLCATHAQQQLRRGRENLIPIGTYVKPGKEGCDVENCTRSHYAKGFCFNHYRTQRRKAVKEEQG